MAACIDLLQERIAGAQEAMDMAQESANSEDKSSAGDKYETGRAMSQIDRDRNARQLEELLVELALLRSVEIDKIHTEAAAGSLIRCGSNHYFIASGLGSVLLDGNKIMILSPRSPFAAQLRGKSLGATVTFNGNTSQISDLF